MLQVVLDWMLQSAAAVSREENGKEHLQMLEFLTHLLPPTATPPLTDASSNMSENRSVLTIKELERLNMQPIHPTSDVSYRWPGKASNELL